MSFTKININKRTSRAIIITFSTILSLLIGIMLVLTGLENTLLNASTSSTNQKTYLSKTIAAHNYSLASTTKTRILTSRYNINLSADIANDIIKYQGQIAGTLTTYNFDWPRQVISPSVARSLLPGLTLPDSDKIPILISNNITYSADIQADIDRFFTIVGTLPGPQTNSYPYLIDTGSSAIDDYLFRLTENSTETVKVNYSIVVTFNDVFSAIKYAQPSLFTHQDPYPAQDFLGNTLEIASIFNQIYTYYWVIAVLLFVITLIALSCFLNHLFHQQKFAKNITLSSLQSAYSLAFIKICLISIIISIAIGSLISFLTHIIGSHNLSTTLQSTYNLSASPSVKLYGLNSQLWFIAIGFTLVILFGISKIAKKARLLIPRTKTTQSRSPLSKRNPNSRSTSAQSTQRAKITTLSKSSKTYTPPSSRVMPTRINKTSIKSRKSA